jgi:starch synthase
MSVDRILFASSEVHPLIKTGGLADVSGSLPVALKNLRRDVRVIMPAYKPALDSLKDVGEVSALRLAGDAQARLLEARLPGSSVRIWLVDSPVHYARDGGPYGTPELGDWPDNAERFTLFARVIEAIALDRAGLDWQPDLVHCNDWQCGLVPALLSFAPARPATVFTIHNLSYQGLFPLETFQRLDLPEELWSMHGIEYFGQASFIKGGISFADMLSTVSPRYASEIQTPAYGCGLETLLRHRADRLVGILNGVDYRQWNPARDPHITRTYNAWTLSGKLVNKTALQARFGLPQDRSVPLIGMIGRLVEQKGVDLMLDILPWLMEQDVQLVVLGSGERELEKRLLAAVGKYPRQLAAHLGYDEVLAHWIEAGADMFVMPSRFEPCGLNQIYSLRYGTVPIVSRTGGLADTVVDADTHALESGIATGYVFNDPLPTHLRAALQRALACYRQPKVWKRLIFQGMQQDFSWRQSARHYLDLYRRAAAHAIGVNGR